MKLDPPSISLSADGRIATMMRGNYTAKVPVLSLRAWRKFYAGLASYRPETYGAWLPVIDRALRDLSEHPQASPEERTAGP